MRKDESDFSRKSKTYKKVYANNLSALYGIKECTAIKPPRKRRVSRLANPIDKPSEYQIQRALIDWAWSRGLLLISIPNAGKRSYWQGQKEVAMGLWKGASDLLLAMPGQTYGGYFIEMKRPGRKPTPEQFEFGQLVYMQNYKWAWFDNWELARNSIIGYLDLNNKDYA